VSAVARWLSIVAHPFVMVGVMVGAVAARRNSPGEAVRSVLTVLVFTAVPLMALMVRQVRAGAWKNVDASNVAERPALYMVGGLALVALLVYSLFANPQSFMVRGAAGTLLMFAVCALATRWIKVSLHMAFAALAATTLLLIGSPAGWVLLPVVPALAWSRLALGRHRPLEVVIGAVIGFLAALSIVLV
jgi:membrane-associated phospholipid phosphatase